MFRGTSMPAAGPLAVLAGDLQQRDEVVLDDISDYPLTVTLVEPGIDHVFVTVSDGHSLLRTVRLHRRIPVELALPVEPVRPWGVRAVYRAAPWAVLVAVVSIWASWSDAPLRGGQWVAVVLFWLVGTLRAVTTPEQER